MSRNNDKQHYSPVFTNKPWVNDASEYACWMRDEHKECVVQKNKGRRQWGYKRKLWSDAIEKSLNHELETPAALIYEKLREASGLDKDERLKWAQFIRSQIVRTPTFMRYEQGICEELGIEKHANCDRVGCEFCGDLSEITGRRWLLIQSHKDDFFIRTDNPVYYTGFLNNPETVLYYPLSPSLCFVASAMNQGVDFQQNSLSPKPIELRKIGKGIAHMFNFSMAKAADESIIMHTKDLGLMSEAMFSEVVGVYPQPPFDLHRPEEGQCAEAKESIRLIMSLVDGADYPEFHTDVLDWMTE